MSKNILDWLSSTYNISNNGTDKQQITQSIDNEISEQKKPNFFDLQQFIENLKHKSVHSKFDRLLFSDNINAYDIAHNCINQVLFRLYNTPVPSYEDVWLPVYMRQVIGTAIHDFIQSNFEFTETEVAIKIPKFKFSGRIDAIINNNVLVEIKSVSFNDYKQIISKNQPREKDVYQTLIYKHLLENYLDEINRYKEELSKEDPESLSKYNWPKQSHYNIQYLQFIYIAHDLISSDISSLSEAIHIQKETKKILKSKYNKFYFIKDIIIDLSANQDSYIQIENKLMDKLKTILSFYHKNTFPPPDNEFIDKKQCFFCMYKNLCSINKNT